MHNLSIGRWIFLKFFYSAFYTFMHFFVLLMQFNVFYTQFLIVFCSGVYYYSHINRNTSIFVKNLRYFLNYCNLRIKLL